MWRLTLIISYIEIDFMFDDYNRLTEFMHTALTVSEKDIKAVINYVKEGDENDIQIT